jgi:hypothetical protein
MSAFDPKRTSASSGNCEPLGRMPIAFLPSCGQAFGKPRVAFVSRRPGNYAKNSTSLCKLMRNLLRSIEEKGCGASGGAVPATSEGGCDATTFFDSACDDGGLCSGGNKSSCYGCRSASKSAAADGSDTAATMELDRVLLGRSLWHGLIP